MWKRYFFVIAVIFSLLPQIAYTQSKAELEKKRTNLKSELFLAEQLLKKTENKSEATLQDLNNLKSILAKRQALIETLDREAGLIKNNIASLLKRIEVKKQQLNRLQENYARLVKVAYLNRQSYNRLMFILAAEHFVQAWRRSQYFKQINDALIKQAVIIKKKKRKIANQVTVLQTKRSVLQNRLAEQKQQKKQMEAERKQMAIVLQELNKKKADLKKKIKQKHGHLSKLNKKIKEIIAREAREAANNSSNSSNAEYALTPEAKKLNTSFRSNKNRLPWPVKRGVIVEKYGTHPHPILEGVEVKNDGIDIMTNSGAMARSVFKGKVSAIFNIQGYQNVVIVRHGLYLSVYAHLDKVFVQKNDAIKTGQNIGTIAKNNQGKNVLNFQVRYKSNTQNPESWLK